MLSMAKGTALFDAVAISDTGASVRARRGGCSGGAARQADACGGGCGRTVCAADCGGRGCAGCAQDGGVVRMDDGAVTFIGGTITGAVAVRARVAFARRKCSCLTLHVAYDAACHGVGMAL